MVLHGSVFPLDHSDPMWAKIDSRKKRARPGPSSTKSRAASETEVLVL